MIVDQNQARSVNRYKQLTTRAEAKDKVMKHIGTKDQTGENIDVYFDNVELTTSTWKTVFYNIFTLAFEAILWIAAIVYFWSPEILFWSMLAPILGFSVIFFYLSLNKIGDIIVMMKMIKNNKKKLN